VPADDHQGARQGAATDRSPAPSTSAAEGVVGAARGGGGRATPRAHARVAPLEGLHFVEVPREHLERHNYHIVPAKPISTSRNQEAKR